MRILVALALTMAATGGATAQEQGPYRLERTEGGYVRMDTRTGQMWLCREDSGRLQCASAAEGEAGPTPNRLEEMESRLQALEDRLRAMDGAAPLAEGLPSEEEFERTLSLMERFMRRFFGIVREFEEETPPPSRT